MTKRVFTLTDESVAHLKACAAQGLTLSATCKELRVSVKELRYRADQQGLRHIVERLFPSRHSGMTQIPYDQGVIDKLVELKGMDLNASKPLRQNKQGR